MIYFRAFVGAGVACALGVAVWAAMAYQIGGLLSWMEFGIGFISGFGVRAMCKERTGAGLGFVAAAVALVAIFVGKFGVAHLLVEHSIAKLVAKWDDTAGAVDLAGGVAEEYQKSGKKLVWPKGKSLANAQSQADFPDDVWAESVKRWQAKPLEQRRAERKQRLAAAADFMVQLRANTRSEIFQNAYALIDLFCAAGVAWIAYRVGCGT